MKAAFVPEDDFFISEEGFSSFFAETVLTNVFQDPTCGNGRCDSPFEYMAFPNLDPPTVSYQDRQVRTTLKSECWKVSD